jgi:hypothetical protein
MYSKQRYMIKFQWLATGWWFSPVSSTNKSHRHDITEILLKAVLTTINLPPITTNIVSSNPTHGEVYSIQHYVIVCQWLAACWWFSLGTLVSFTNKTVPRYNWNIVESGIQHHNPIHQMTCYLQEWYWLENQWKIADAITPPFKMVIFCLFWQCPTTFGKQFSEENSWNQLDNWKKIISVVIRINKLCFILSYTV